MSKTRLKSALKPKLKTKNVKFCCHSPNADQVFLSGTFNDWQPDAKLMERDDQGNWKAELKLPPGRYEYKFVVDGQWCCEAEGQEPAECPECIPNGLGTMNRFVDIE